MTKPKQQTQPQTDHHKHCETCRFFHDATRTCHRLPPRQTFNGAGVFTVVSQEDWCGEWRER